jgi:hypothetical protein
MSICDDFRSQCLWSKNYCFYLPCLVILLHRIPPSIKHNLAISECLHLQLFLWVCLCFLMDWQNSSYSCSNFQLSEKIPTASVHSFSENQQAFHAFFVLDHKIVINFIYCNVKPPALDGRGSIPSIKTFYIHYFVLTTPFGLVLITSSSVLLLSLASRTWSSYLNSEIHFVTLALDSSFSVLNTWFGSLKSYLWTSLPQLNNNYIV